MATRVRFGKLRHQLHVQTLTEGRRASGGVTKSYGTTVTLPASVEDLSGTELRNARQLYAKATHRVTVRYHADVTPKGCRFLWQVAGKADRAFYPLAVDNVDGKDRYLLCTCEERT